MSLKKLRLETTVIAFPAIVTLKAKTNSDFRKFVASRDCIVQFRLADGSFARHVIFKGGKVSSKSGMHPSPDVVLQFKDVDTALTFLTPPLDYSEFIHAAKNFRILAMGNDEAVGWFSQVGNRLTMDGTKFGEAMPDGSHRYTQMTNGGPIHVYVKDGKIIRSNMIEFNDEDPEAWTIDARGKKFSPRRRSNVAPHAITGRSAVYSKDRVLYPMKRVDFDPNGERNPQNRGKSGYERISWDEALEIVGTEIKRQKTVHGPGSIVLTHPSHHQWGNIGYYLSALMRFGNCVGVTRMGLNPDSWEGWYWGAMHHHGNSMRIGTGTGYGTLEDALQEAELMVYWSSDPESQMGSYGGTEASEHRLWGREVGIENIHVNPHYSPTAAFTGGKWMPITPGTDTALALSLMYTWIEEDTYDHHFVENRTTGFDEWKAYLLGETDGIPKTPEWQEGETGVPAREARALAQLWSRKKTYLACGMNGVGFGGACRNETGIQWARAMVMIMAMQGWGRPGVNMGSLNLGSPVDLEFYFPGYGDGGISGELMATGAATHNYCRMPHILSMNPVQQIVPRQRMPEAILDGHAEGYLLEPTSIEGQLRPYFYPAPGHSKIKMMYRYGASSMGTTNGADRFVKMYQSDELECVVAQVIWNEGDAKFADIILPACTQYERADIGEFSGGGGLGLHWQSQLNYRIIAMQHKCIEPLGESKSDYQIFWDVCKQLGLGNVFSEGCSELDWTKRIFESSDLPKKISWKEFCKKGYYVVPPEVPECKVNVDMRWFYDGKPKDLPEPFPLPASYSEQFLHGLQTQSGKFEFVPNSLKKLDPIQEERPPLMQYTRPKFAEGGPDHKRLPIQLLTVHQRFSFHTHQDGKGSTINDLEDHRIEVDGHYYHIIRLSEEDSEARGIKHHQLVRVFNDQGSVICAAEVTNRMKGGVAHSYASCAVYESLDEPGESPEIGGCLNILTPNAFQAKKSVASAGALCLVDVELWQAAKKEEMRTAI